MKLKKVKNIMKFNEDVAKCKGNVFLKSECGDVYNLKSELSQYIAMAALLGYHGDKLELYCNADDRANFEEFL